MTREIIVSHGITILDLERAVKSARNRKALRIKDVEMELWKQGSWKVKIRSLQLYVFN
jgi:hypothetical protein